MHILDEMTKTRIDILLMQARQFQLRAEWMAKRIETGAWKARIGQLFHGDKTPYTEQEVLDEEVETMKRHTHIADDHINSAASLLEEWTTR